MTKRKKSTFERLTDGPLNRKQRRELGRRLVSDDPGLTIIHPNAGRIDVGNLLGHLFRMPVEGGSATQLTFGRFYDCEPAVSPDGRTSLLRPTEMAASGIFLFWIFGPSGFDR